VADGESGVFTECWDTLSVNPYPGDPVPDSFPLWVVDSLDSYCCPYKAAPSTPFGLRNGRRHQGVDIPCFKGMPVRAAFDGRVRVSASVAGYGELVIVRHPNGLETFYAHLSGRDVASGGWVRAGDVVGRCGSTGRSSGAKLHFETRYRGFAFDPTMLIDFESGILRHRLVHIRSSYFDSGCPHDQSVPGRCNCCQDGEGRLADYYTVRSGDTLARIARKNGTSVKDICRFNGIKENTPLRVGQRLKVR
jgi:murein DD-endopeptidase MepM/ murein hydrolase activator NlpD